MIDNVLEGYVVTLAQLEQARVGGFAPQRSEPFSRFGAARGFESSLRFGDQLLVQFNGFTTAHSVIVAVEG